MELYPLVLEDVTESESLLLSALDPPGDGQPAEPHVNRRTTTLVHRHYKNPDPVSRNVYCTF